MDGLVWERWGGGRLLLATDATLPEDHYPVTLPIPEKTLVRKLEKLRTADPYAERKRYFELKRLQFPEMYTPLWSEKLPAEQREPTRFIAATQDVKANGVRLWGPVLVVQH